MQDNIFRVANFLIDKKVLDISSLVSTQLDNFANFQILLYGSIATEILLESLANSLHVQIIREARNRRNTLSSVSLLDTYVDLFFRRDAALISGLLKGVCLFDKTA